MRTLYFYSVPTSSIPSPYFFSYRAMLRHLSRKGILQFRTWQGRHDSTMPVTEISWHSPEHISEGVRGTGEA